MYLGKKMTVKWVFAFMGIVLLASCGSSSEESGTTSEAWGGDQAAADGGEFGFDDGDDPYKPKKGEFGVQEELKPREEPLEDRTEEKAASDNTAGTDSTSTAGKDAMVAGAPVAKPVDGCIDSLESLNRQVMALRENNKSLNDRLEKLLLAETPFTSPTTANSYQAPNTKVYYRLQMSAISASAGKQVYPGMEAFIENYDGKFRFMYGYFTRYQDAKEAKAMLERIGVQGAWIVKYVDGRRIAR